VAGEKVQAADEFTQHFRGVVLAVLHEATELMATEGERDVVVVFHGMIVSACPGALAKEENMRTPMRMRAASWKDWSPRRREVG
jgi:hypothetical protein